MLLLVTSFIINTLYPLIKDIYITENHKFFRDQFALAPLTFCYSLNNHYLSCHHLSGQAQQSQPLSPQALASISALLQHTLRMYYNQPVTSYKDLQTLLCTIPCAGISHEQACLLPYPQLQLSYFLALYWVHLSLKDFALVPLCIECFSLKFLKNGYLSFRTKNYQQKNLLSSSFNIKTSPSHLCIAQLIVWHLVFELVNYHAPQI